LARFLRSAILLAAALLPLAMQAGAVLDLLDAGRVAHPAAIVELLVHGHNHGKAVVTHAHLAPIAVRTSALPKRLRRVRPSRHGESSTRLRFSGSSTLLAAATPRRRSSS